MEVGRNIESLVGHLLRPFSAGEGKLASRRKMPAGALHISVKSDAFEPGTAIPRRYSAEGENLSPPISWGRVPSGTLECLLVCEDPDAPRTTPFLHWILYNIPPSVEALPEGLAPSAQLEYPNGARQGKNGSGKTGYFGPLPPVGHGRHHYYFELFALDRHLESAEVGDRELLIRSLENHIVGYGEFQGTYERK